MTSVSVFHHPRSVAIIGASDNPDKIGGRSIHYMKQAQYQGNIYPVNPTRDEVQGLQAYASVADLPEVPDVVIVAISGERAADQVVVCAELGVRGCIIMASGFGETGDAAGLALQEKMLDAAKRAGMRIIGPNSQGLANFSNGAVLSFSTLFTEQPPEDGPVGIISQSGAMCSVPYGLLREAGIGVRYAHGTGNDIDVTVGELATDIVQDPDIKLLLLYLEDLKDPDSIAELARVARERRVPVIALKGGRSEAGQRAAASHTGALANEERVVDAFLRKHGIWHARNSRDLVIATELYLQGWNPQGNRISIISNSGAVCVLTADAAADHSIELSEFSAQTQEKLQVVLPSFAATENPVDVTAALLTDSSLFGKVLPIIGADPNTQACVIGIPVSGKGYDVDRFADDVSTFIRETGMPVVMIIPQSYIAKVFRERGIIVFADEESAVAALSQFLLHRDLMTQSMDAQHVPVTQDSEPAPTRTLNEWESFKILEAAGVPVVQHVLVHRPGQVEQALAELGAGPVVVKGCTSDVAHKSELGLVRVGVQGVDDVSLAVTEMNTIMDRGGFSNEGVLISRLVDAVHEGMIGCHTDPIFGPVVVIGAGGVYVEAMPDAQVLLPPFSRTDALRAIGELRISAVLDGARGKPPVDVDAWADVAVELGNAALDDSLAISSLDVNPLMLLQKDTAEPFSVCAVDALVVQRTDHTSRSL